MRAICVIMVVATVAGVLSGCGAAPSAPAVGQAQAVEGGAGSAGYSSTMLSTEYEGAVPVSSQLALGILRLEGTENAVTTEQAKALLPLWRALQAGKLQSDLETNAVLQQIEGTMTREQLGAVAAMGLTMAEMGDWARQQGLDLGPPPEAMAAAEAGGGGASRWANLSEEERASLRATREAGGGGGAGPGGFGNMSDEERASMRATAEAGGGGFGPPGFGNLSDEERASLRATAEAGGITFGAGRPAGLGEGRLGMVVGPLVELLARRAAE